jgi:hypothetical protein
MIRLLKLNVHLTILIQSYISETYQQFNPAIKYIDSHVGLN